VVGIFGCLPRTGLEIASKKQASQCHCETVLLFNRDNSSPACKNAHTAILLLSFVQYAQCFVSSCRLHKAMLFILYAAQNILHDVHLSCNMLILT
jgi:hypothetical protein